MSLWVKSRLKVHALLYECQITKCFVFVSVLADSVYLLLVSPQLENQIKRCAEGSIQREELETQREVMLAAHNLQLVRMEHLDLTQIKKCALVVISHGKSLT